jgi:tripartite-type tricarboxylate transporter receptor subunit TctC
MNISRRQLLLDASCLSLGTALASPSLAQGISNKAVRLIIAQAAATTPDAIARLLAPRMQARWGQPFVVENRAGASGAIGMEAIAKATPDGHSMQINVSTTVTLPLFYTKLSFDPLASFTPISYLGATNFNLAVHPSVPVTTVREWVEWVKSQPGQLSYATPGLGTHHHLCMELLKQTAGVDLLHIPYKAAGQAYTDFIGGQVLTMFLPMHNALGFAKDSRIRILAGTKRERFHLQPNLPSLHESGIKDFNVEAWYALWGPVGLSSELTTKYNQLVREVLTDPEVLQGLEGEGIVARASSPAELAKIGSDEFNLWKRVVRESGIKAV